MRATLNIPDKLMDELTLETGEKNKTRLIQLSLEEMLKKVKREKLKRLRGAITIDLDLKALREKDLL
jgi:hypothetical protein